MEVEIIYKTDLIRTRN